MERTLDAVGLLWALGSWRESDTWARALCSGSMRLHTFSELGDCEKSWKLDVRVARLGVGYVDLSQFRRRGIV